MRVVEKQTPCIQTWYYKLGLLLKEGGWKETEIEIKRDCKRGGGSEWVESL